MKGEIVSEQKLFGYPKWEVESLADNITRTQEAEISKSGLYKAALKLLERRKRAITAVVQAVRGKK